MRGMCVWVSLTNCKDRNVSGGREEEHLAPSQRPPLGLGDPSTQHRFASRPLGSAARSSVLLRAGPGRVGPGRTRRPLSSPLPLGKWPAEGTEAGADAREQWRGKGDVCTLSLRNWGRRKSPTVGSYKKHRVRGGAGAQAGAGGRGALGAARQLPSAQPTSRGSQDHVPLESAGGLRVGRKAAARRSCSAEPVPPSRLLAEGLACDCSSLRTAPDQDLPGRRAPGRRHRVPTALGPPNARESRVPSLPAPEPRARARGLSLGTTCQAMATWLRSKDSCRCLVLLAALLLAESAQLGSARAKLNSIKSTLGGETPAQAANRSAGIYPGLAFGGSKKGKHLGQAYPCSSDKECEVGRYCHSPHQASSSCMVCRRKKKRCHRDGMCCPGTRCNNGICIPVTESILTAHIPALDGTRHRDRNHGHYSNHDLGWQNLGRPHSKMSHIKGHEGDPCLRSSDCMEGFCCARHFWTKICKPVLLQGEVCTKQRKKGSHGLEIFQRCDCAKGLSCKVWKDATYSSKARLHVCQKI